MSIRQGLLALQAQEPMYGEQQDNEVRSRDTTQVYDDRFPEGAL